MLHSCSSHVLVSKEENKNEKEESIICSDDSDGIWGEGDEQSDVSAVSSNSDAFSDVVEIIEEDPFEPAYASPLAEDDGITIEEVSLDNILPSGTLRLRT
jgi:hypothetical protein